MQSELRVDQASVQATAAGIKRWGQSVLSDVVTAAARTAVEMESYGKRNRPWRDQTGMARSGLSGFVRREGGDIVIGLAHGVDYGQYLERCRGGRYAILMPTVEHFARKFRESVAVAVRTAS